MPRIERAPSDHFTPRSGERSTARPNPARCRCSFVRHDHEGGSASTSCSAAGRNPSLTCGRSRDGAPSDQRNGPTEVPAAAILLSETGQLWPAHVRLGSTAAPPRSQRSGPTLYTSPGLSCLRRNAPLLSRPESLTLWQPRHPTVFGCRLRISRWSPEREGASGVLAKFRTGRARPGGISRPERLDPRRTGDVGEAPSAPHGSRDGET